MFVESPTIDTDGISKDTYEKLAYLARNKLINQPFGWAYEVNGKVGTATYGIPAFKGIGVNHACKFE